MSDRVAQGLQTQAQLDSVAYQIHNLYCAVEDLLKLVANAFENHIGAGLQRLLTEDLHYFLEQIRG